VHFECAEARTTIELAKKALKAGKVGWEWRLWALVKKM
jgi:hypothetical protein